MNLQQTDAAALDDASRAGPQNNGPVTEIELKLRLDPADVGRFRRCPLLRDHKIARAGASHLISTYFDTPSLALRGKKVALRLRQAGRSIEQTLKAPKGIQGGLQARSEWNAYVESAEPQLDLIGDTRLRKWLLKRQEAEGLEPVFVTDIKRTTWQIVYGQSRMEVALDQGEIRSGGDKKRPISEVELELQSGDAADLLAFALELVRTYRLVLDKDSKAARGYALFVGEDPQPVRAAGPSVSHKMSVLTAFAGFMRSGIEQSMANAPVVLLGEDPEGVHQARVGIRRMRSALSIYKSVLDPAFFDWAKSELSWLQTSLGPARDLDVLLEETLAPLNHRFGSDPTLEAVTKTAWAARDTAYAQAIETLQSARYSEILLRLEGWLLEIDKAENGSIALTDFAAKNLDKRLKRVLRDGGKKPSKLEEEFLHPLRIDLKKLRYAAAFFRGLYSDKAAKPYVRQLGALQDCLGGLNDALVQSSVLEHLSIPRGKTRDRMQGMLDGWHSARIEQGLSHLDREWSALRNMRPFWR